jgi:hypothetical protein
MSGRAHQVFLLSPAFCGGRRAGVLTAPASKSPLAARLSEGTLPLGEAFSFLSGLYFRGKLTYAAKFARAPEPHQGVLIITPTRGLQPPSLPMTPALLAEFASLDLATAGEQFLTPLAASARALRASLGAEGRAVLLGSIATSKYLGPLADALDSRLDYPSEFVGRGDMSRGGLLLRCADEGRELDYVPLVAGMSRRGQRPPRLEKRKGFSFTRARPCTPRTRP